MWWIVLLMFGCVTQPETEPGAPEAPRQAKAKVKAKAGKQPAQGGQKRLPPTARKGPQKPLGQAGEVQGALVFETEEDKTKATLKMTWEGGEATALLGTTPGTCAAAPAKALPDGTEPLWWATCESTDKKAEFAVGQKGDVLWVQRALVGEEGLGEWKQVRTVPLVKGTVLKAP